MLDEIATLQTDMAAVEQKLKVLTTANHDVQRLQTITGVGLLTSTVLVAAVGSPDRSPAGKHLGSWLGLTAKEDSSGNRRRLGRITKMGGVYIRTLLIHGARSVLRRTKALQRAGKRLPSLPQLDAGS